MNEARPGLGGGSTNPQALSTGHGHSVSPSGVVTPSSSSNRLPTPSNESLPLGPATGEVKSKIHGITQAGSSWVEHAYKRSTINSQRGACRVRSFHGRLSDQGLMFMDNAINEWLDAHPDIDVKFVTSNTGLYESKVKEESIILNVWY